MLFKKSNTCKLIEANLSEKEIQPLGGPLDRSGDDNVGTQALAV